MACAAPTTEAASGFRGPVLTGLRVSVDGTPADDQANIELARDNDLDLTLEVITELGEPACVEADPDLPCPDPEDARLDFTLAATLNLDRPVTLESHEPAPGPAASPGRHLAPVRLEGPGRQERSFTVEVPDLEPGRHCLLITLVEEAAGVVAGQLPDHSSAAAWWVTVGDSSTNHCAAAAGGPEREATTDPPACRPPLLSVLPSGTRLNRRVEAGQELFAAVPVCGGSAVGLLVHDGRPQLHGRAVGPFLAVDGDRGAPVFSAGTLASGAWHLVSVEFGESDDAPSSAVSQPVLVGD